MPLLLLYKAAVIGRTGRGDYGHGLDVAMLTHPKLQVVAVADDNPEGLAKAAKRLQVERAYTDYRAMLEKERPAFVSVCPRWLDPHREMVEACAEYGVRGIFCEKPLCPTLADADAMVSACQRSHVQLAIAFQTRFSPRYQRVQELLADGAIGQVLEIRSRGKEDRRGGGEDLMVLGSHTMDMIRGLLGDPSWCFARVTEGGKPVGKGQVREGAEGIGPLAGDRIDALYGFGSTAAVAHFATSRPEIPGSRFGIQVFGTKGVLSIGMGWLPPAFLLEDPTWTGSRSSARPITSAGLDQPEPITDTSLDAANRLIVADLVEAVEEDRSSKVNVLDARASLEMILAVYASHVAGKPMHIPLADRQVHPLLQLGA